MKAIHNRLARVLHRHLNDGDITSMLRRWLIAVAVGFNREEAERIRESLQEQMNLLAEQLDANDGLTEMILRMGRKAHATKPLHPDPRLQTALSSTGDCEGAVESLCHYFVAYRAQLHICLRWAWNDLTHFIENHDMLNDGYALRVIDIENALCNSDIPDYARPNLDSELGRRAMAYVDLVRKEVINVEEQKC